MELNFILALSIIVFWSSIIHGSIGFGFGMIATPLVALYTDIQTAITYLLFPTMMVNIVSILSNGKFFEALKKFWFIIFLMVIGSSFGTFLLIFSNSEFFKLLLAFIILIYLAQSFIKIEASFISKYPKSSTYGLGLVGGLLSGLTNVVAPLMIIYTLELKYSRKDTIQLSNLCFLFTKIGQLMVFLYFGSFSSETFGGSIIAVLVVLFGMFLGIKINKKIDAKFYTKILKVLLFVIACMLIVQTTFY
ncbi:sulfite exporter TauE/SafE family protein [Arcobacter sp. LA11]|uniref:sulfite exporter TauE/SafE family protein n=1 Tax=Arcobacter sp. LA11 TaxID=1898176 RepID=UPI000933A23A|nr:sulfite exporter TauE/SafE family protein [Arcobacter sp. LA11]